MILVTVGGNTPFDRMLHVVDAWHAKHPEIEVFAQIGETDYRPAHLPFELFLAPAEFDARLRGARAVVAHAGMGTVLSALEAGVPLLVFPRRFDLNETRNDHQRATATHLVERGLVQVAWDEAELAERLEAQDFLVPPTAVGGQRLESLRRVVRGFVEGS